MEVLVHYIPDLKCHGIDGKGCPSNCFDVELFTIDHINNDGAIMRKIHGVGSAFYLWLKKNNFPKHC